MRLALFAAALLLAGCDRQEPKASPAQAAPAMALTGRVIDRADILQPAEEQRLAAISEQLERRTTDQLVIVTLDTLNGASIEQVGYALGNVWGVGRQEVDNGVLLLVAPSERRVRIEVGRGLEGLLTDERAAGVVNQILPEFRQGRMAEGMMAGAQGISTILSSSLERPQGKAVS